MHSVDETVDQEHVALQQLSLIKMPDMADGVDGMSFRGGFSCSSKSQT